MNCIDIKYVKQRIEGDNSILCCISEKGFGFLNKSKTNPLSPTTPDAIGLAPVFQAQTLYSCGSEGSFSATTY